MNYNNNNRSRKSISSLEDNINKIFLCKKATFVF